MSIKKSTANYSEIIVDKTDDDDVRLSLPTTNMSISDSNKINENELDRQYSFINSKAKSNQTNYKYLTFSTSNSNAGRTFDKSLRNIFKYIRLYNGNSNNNNNNNNTK